MNTGIRNATATLFAQHLPNVRHGITSPREFRRAVMQPIMEQFGIPLHCAATAYNNALVLANSTEPGLREMLQPEIAELSYAS